LVKDEVNFVFHLFPIYCISMFYSPNNFGTWYCITVLDSICCASGVERSIARNDFNRRIKSKTKYKTPK
ncbi:hypothetical protein T10_2674, partial [Trichinella papuae]